MRCTLDGSNYSPTIRNEDLQHDFNNFVIEVKEILLTLRIEWDSSEGSEVFGLNRLRRPEGVCLVRDRTSAITAEDTSDCQIETQNQ